MAVRASLMAAVSRLAVSNAPSAAKNGAPPVMTGESAIIVW